MQSRPGIESKQSGAHLASVTKGESVALTLVGCVAALFVLQPSAWLLTVLGVTLGGIAVFSPSVGMAGWVMLAPFDSFLSGPLQFSPFIVLSPAVFLGIGIRLIAEADHRLPFGLLLYPLLIALPIIGATLLGSEQGSPRTLIAVLHMLVMAALIGAVLGRRSGLKLIITGLLISFGIAAVVGVTMPQLVWRLGIGEDVRHLANVSGLLAVLLSARFLLSRQDWPDLEHLPLMRWPRLQFILLLLCIITLAGTVARGVLLAVVIAIMGIVLVGVFYTGRVTVATLRPLMVAAGLLLLAGIAGLLIDQFLARGHLAGRILYALQSPLENPRIEIWRVALVAMDGWDWLVGKGPGTFRDVVMSVGIDHHSHSVFVAFLVEAGVVGLLALLIPLAHSCIRALRYRNPVALGVLGFVVVAFSTSGTMVTKGFWLGLGLLLGITFHSLFENRHSPGRLAVPKEAISRG